MEGNLVDLYRAFTTLPGAELVESDRLCYHHAIPSNPLFKAVWRTNLPAVEADAAIDQVIDWYSARSAPFFYWWVDPHTRPEDLPRRLLAKGFTKFMSDLPCMAIDLQNLNEEIPPPQGFTLQQASSLEQLVQWRDIFVAAYDAPAFAAQAWVDATLSLGIDRAPWQMVLGLFEGKPVACGTFFEAAGVVGVLNIGTLESVRGRGIATAITTQPLLETHQRGCRIAVLFASELGYPVYLRLGFQDLEYKLSRYIWFNT